MGAEINDGIAPPNAKCNGTIVVPGARLLRLHDG